MQHRGKKVQLVLLSEYMPGRRCSYCELNPEPVTTCHKYPCTIDEIAKAQGKAPPYDCVGGIYLRTDDAVTFKLTGTLETTEERRSHAQR